MASSSWAGPSKSGDKLPMATVCYRAATTVQLSSGPLSTEGRSSLVTPTFTADASRSCHEQRHDYRTGKEPKQKATEHSSRNREDGSAPQAPGQLLNRAEQLGSATVRAAIGSSDCPESAQQA